MSKSFHIKENGEEKNTIEKSDNQNYRRILITGGAGFIGSHLVDYFMNEGREVVVLDDLSNGSMNNINKWIGNKKFRFIQGDLKNQNDIINAIKDCEIVFHLAANPDVRKSVLNSQNEYEQNVACTYHVLEAMKNSDCKKMVFTSTSTIYGEPAIIPTPENYGPLMPISPYGGSKLACESLVSAYSHSFGFKSTIIRLANVIGPRSNHGVVFDFVQKLKKNLKTLEVLGDGSQNKSYMHVSDCISSLIMVSKEQKPGLQLYNVGSLDKINVLTIAKCVIDSMHLKDVEIKLTGGVDGGRGWVGDVKEMMLDISKIGTKGWSPKFSSSRAVQATVDSLI